jgi:hypothetical protein
MTSSNRDHPCQPTPPSSTTMIDRVDLERGAVRRAVHQRYGTPKICSAPQFRRCRSPEDSPLPARSSARWSWRGGSYELYPLRPTGTAVDPATISENSGRPEHIPAVAAPYAVRPVMAMFSVPQRHLEAGP